MQLVQLDDVIPKAYQDQLESQTNSLGWSFRLDSARAGLGFANTFPGFFHLALDVSAQVHSPLGALLAPLLFVGCEKAGLKVTALLRIELAMFPQTLVDVPHHNPFVDFHEPHLVGLYHVDDSDGDTVIFEETSAELSVPQSVQRANLGQFTEGARVSPRKGRMAFFDGRHYRASMHPRAHAARRVVTFNFR